MHDETRRPRHARHSHAASPRRVPRDISSIGPASSSQESMRQATRRRSRVDKVVDPAARRRRRRRILVTTLVAVVVVLLASVAAGWAYMNSIGAKINAVANSDSGLAGVLDSQTTKPGEPFYMVLMGSDTRPGQSQQRSDTLIIARLDPQNKKVQMISIPRDSRVAIPGAGTTKINAAAVYGGPSLVIKTVKNLTGLPITHYANVNFNGFRDVVDAMGGVWINVPFNIYDTQASAFGKKYATLKKGYQKLDGAHALTFARTRHFFAEGDFQRMRNQQALIKALASQALSLANIFKASSIINAVASNLDTDMTPAQMADLVLQFKGMKSSDIQSMNAPGAPKYINGTSYVVLDQVKLAQMISRMKQGLSLDPSKGAGGAGLQTGITVKAADVPLTVRNGAGVSGLGKQASTFFTSKGFTVSETGNMAQYVYGRTLVVYQKGHEAQANFVRETLGFGDVVASAGMYSFKTNVMVVIGKDWKDPTATAQ